LYDRPHPSIIDAPCKYFLGSGCKFGVTCRFKHDSEKRDRERRRSPGRVRERSRERSRERRRVRKDDSDDESILKGGDSSDDEDVEKKIALVKKKNAELRNDKDRKEGQAGMDPPPLNPPLPSQTPQNSEIAEMAERSTVNESVNTTVDQTAVADGTIVDQHKRRAWTIKSTHDETKDHTRDEKGFEKFEDYFSESDADESLVKASTEDSLVKPSSAPTSVIQTVNIQNEPAPHPEESILEPVLEQVSVETPPVILNPGNLEESVPGPVQDSVAGGPGQHPATPPTDAISEEGNPAEEALEEPSDPVEAIAEQVVQEEVVKVKEVGEEKASEEKEVSKQPVVEEPFVEERAALLTSLQQPTEHLPAELLAEEEEPSQEPVKEAVAEQSLEKEEVVDEKEESFEDEAPLTKPGATLEDKKEQVSSPRRPPNKEEAAKAIAEAAKEVKEATEGLEVKEEKDRQDKIKQEKKTKLEKEEKAKREKIKADKILAEKAKSEKRQAEKVRQEKLLADKVATTPKKTAAELAGEWGDDDEDSSSATDKAVTTPTGTMSDKPKRERKLPAKLLDGAVEDTPSKSKTPKNKKLDMEKSESGKKSHKKAPKNEEVEESLENIEKEMAKPIEKVKKESPKKGSHKKGAAAKQPKEDWVTLIFGENGEKITKNGKKVEAEEKAAADDSGSLELNEAEEFLMKGTPFFTKEKDNKTDSRRGRPRKQDLAAKTDAVTKIGNNMYFYTGPGGSGSPPPLVDNEDEDEEWSELDKKKAASVSSSASEVEGSRKSSRAGKGRNPRLERDDEEEVDLPKLAASAPAIKDSKSEMTAGEAVDDDTGEVSLNVPSPAGRGRRGSKTGSTITSTPAAARARSGRSSVDSKSSRTSNTRTRSATPPRDEDLPEFDPEKFTPGYIPKTVKKGDDEYVIVVSGVPDTGLCGKYWGDLTNLPSRRRSGMPTPETTTPKTAPKKAAAATDVKKAATPPPQQKKSHKKQEKAEKPASPAPPPATKSSRRKAETPPPPAETSGRGRKRKVEETPAVETPEPEKVKKRKAEEQEAVEGEAKGKKRKSEPEGEQAKTKAAKTAEASPLKTEKDKEEAITTTYSDYETPETQPLRTTKRPSTNRKDEAGSSSPDKQSSPLTTKGAAAISAALQSGTPAGQQRSVSCVADTNTQREVVVECFAPYDDHRWVNIGKERDGMAPDAVQYARALRPPYHLLSFLRIKGHSTKGMSCTDKNTMVFVVLEGEITVILHTTQFNAKKGDSFYIPPKNYYNLINQKAREAELSLIQFQYDGPLPTVAPSQT